MARTVVYAVSAALLVAVAASQSIVTCGECDRSKCAVTASCPGGVVLDTCGCCEVCARGLGQLCENTTTEDTPTTTHYGVCGQYLVCRTRTDTGGTGEATCECEDSGAVCGSDGVTYTTLCHLLMETAERPDLSVAVRGPCKTGDDSSFAVQVRGGPEPYMITGWVQIMRVTNENLGIYNCVATNSEGEARASVSLATEKLDISPSSGTINTN
ncbi:kazal-type serine protease inhibitor domain-containing protein 1 isoform X3 [Cherax quadricarinatus]|uniref:kazal-type serine protease inhibitor domain-containing protein 1 isoform X3 n=1 Tax=Cherax quadricarinatus TaxID=27406 RepID=UPI00387EE09F